MTHKTTMPEPVAYVTDVFQIVWSGTGPIASMVDRHEITTGTPLITTDQAEAYANGRVREALEEAAMILKANAEVCHSDTAIILRSNAEAIRALIAATK